MFPVIDVEGEARERGRRYGEGARERVRASIAAYEEIFRHYTGWSRDRVREEAERFRVPIAEYGPAYLEEIAGIAEGAAVAEADVLAINVRTEVMFAAEAERVAGAHAPRSECSAFAVLGDRAGGSLLVGQNWDWLAHAFDTAVVLRVRQPDAPNFVTVVEAGLLAKAGMNSAGVALATNMLITDADRGESAVPYHVLLRSLFDAESPSEALGRIQSARRASSANFVIGGDEVAIDVEAAPGGFDQVSITYPDDDLLLHFNHFVQPVAGRRDVSITVAPNSPFRQARVEHLVRAARGPLDVAFWQRALGDHAMFPESVCHHPDPRTTSAPERHATVLGVVMEPSTRTIWLAPGSPCSTPWERVDTAGVLDKPSPLQAHDPRR